MTFHAIAVPGVLALALAWGLAAVVLSTGPGARRDRLLALLLVVEGIAWGTGSGFLYLTTSATVAWYLQAIFITSMLALPCCYLAFVGTLSTPLVTPLRSRAALVVLAGLAAGAEAWWFTHRDQFIGGIVPAWYATWDADLPPAAVWAMNAVGAISIVSLLATLSAWRRAAPGSAARRQARAFAIAFGVHDVGMFVFTFLLPGNLVPPPPSGSASDLVIIIGADVTTLVFVLLVSYGILKLQLFDIDLRLKRGIRGGAVAAVFVAAFLIVEQFVQNYFSAQFGTLLGAVTAGLMLFGLGPIRRFAESLVNGAMPNVAPTTDYLAFRKLEVYRSAFESLYADEVISDKERAMLDRLRIKLAILPGDAIAVERDVRGERVAAVAA